MKTNKTIKLISSLLIILIIFSLTLSLSAGCTQKEVSPDTGTATVDDPEGDAAIFALFIAVFIEAEGKRIKNEKALDKAIQEANEEKKAKASAAQESFNAEIEAGYDFRKDFLNTLLYGPGGAEWAEGQRRINAYVKKMIEIGADSEKQDSENQNASVTTVPQAQENTQTTEVETTQTTEEEKPTGTITLKIDWSGIPGEMIIDFNTGAVTGSYDYEGEVATAVGSFNGSIDISTNIIAASGSETFTGNLTGKVTTSSISLKGTLSPDYKSAEGTITNDDGEFPWTGKAQ